MFDEGLIKINGKDYVTLYGICIAIGIIFCIWTLHILGKKLKVEKKNFHQFFKRLSKKWFFRNLRTSMFKNINN